MSKRLILITLLAVCMLSGPLPAQSHYRQSPSAGVLEPAFPENRKPKDKKAAVTESSMLPLLRAGLGFTTAFPLGDFNKTSYTGYGTVLDGEYFLIPDQLTAGLSAGFISHRLDEIRMGVGNYNIIPIQARGAWYFLEGGFRPYAGLNAGLFLTRTKYDSIIEPRSYLDPVSQLYVHVPGGVNAIKTSKSVFGFAPVIGLVYNIYDRYWIHFNTRYTMMLTDPESTASVGIHIGLMYSFDL